MYTHASMHRQFAHNTVSKSEIWISEPDFGYLGLQTKNVDTSGSYNLPIKIQYKKTVD